MTRFPIIDKKNLRMKVVKSFSVLSSTGEAKKPVRYEDPVTDEEEQDDELLLQDTGNILEE